MDCDKCGDLAVMHAAYSGLHLCSEHFRRSVEKRVRRRVREDSLLSRDATPEAPETWVVGLSGGKDSVVLASVLHDVFHCDPRVELVALTIHEGIEGYRDASLEACLELTDRLGIAHEVVGYEEEFGLRMDDVAREDPEGMAPCAYCGVFRRDLLERYADELGADKLLTGHNLDDEAQTALMNFLSGDVRQIAKHFDASLGPFEEREASASEGREATASDGREASASTERGSSAAGERTRPDGHDDWFVPRAKPLRDVPEKEVALYAHLRDLPVHMAECPHASEAYRGEVRDLLLSLEEDHPGTRHSIMSGYEELARLASESQETQGGPALGECERCGAPTTRDLCRKCDLLEAVHEASGGADGERRPD